MIEGHFQHTIGSHTFHVFETRRDACRIDTPHEPHRNARCAAAYAQAPKGKQKRYISIIIIGDLAASFSSLLGSI